MAVKAQAPAECIETATVPAPVAPSAPTHSRPPPRRATPGPSAAAGAEPTSPKVDLAAAAPTIRPMDRRAALAAHLARRPAPTPARSEAGLQTSMRDLQRKCADLSSTLAEVHARQGPLLQRLQTAQAALTTLTASPASAGTAAVQALQATLSQTLQVHWTMQPSP